MYAYNTCDVRQNLHYASRSTKLAIRQIMASIFVDRVLKDNPKRFRHAIHGKKVKDLYMEMSYFEVLLYCLPCSNNFNTSVIGL